MSELDAQTVILKNVRLGYCDLWEPKSLVKDSAPKFSAHFLIDESTKEGKANRKALDAAWAYVVQETWKGKEPRLKEDRKAVLDGDDCVSQSTGEVYKGYSGMTVVKAASPEKKRPDVRNRKKEPVREGDAGAPYAGCMVDAVVRLYAITDADKGGNGIFGSIGLIRFRGDGEPLGGGGIDVDKALDLLDDFDDEDDI
jgi:hypothetical protein